MDKDKEYKVDYLDAAMDDLKSLDGSQRIQVLKAINRVKANPLPKSEGGYGQPLGNVSGSNLTGLCKIKLLKLGIRVVYKLIRENNIMSIVVIAARADSQVYQIAEDRTKET
ncbi:MAG: type II toxin-antitoxin system RelE/ParE family toxin [Oscillospiraceae bacterium]|nr:type II toxin-antitoxin system RelE/ParE family toxin [Oscillospiraceae bacterium]